MAYPNAPQDFSFQNRSLTGRLIGFTGETKRRGAKHQFAKRKGQRVEDQERGPQRLSVVLEFIGDDCAKQYQDFKATVDENPFGLLVHPIAGKWFAFCEGPSEDVQFGRSTNEIKVLVSWEESELDNRVEKDVPDVATAAQNATALNSKSQQASAALMGGIAKAQLFEARAVAAVDKVLDQIATAEAPLDFVRSSVAVIGGIKSAVIGAISQIAVKAELVAQEVTDFIASTSDVFDGSLIAASRRAFLCVACAFCAFSAIRTASSFLARRKFWCWFLPSIVTWIPVGKCVMRMHEAVRFRCCPPGPVPVIRSILRSLSFMWRFQIDVVVAVAVAEADFKIDRQLGD
jgi:hypothetical protein